MHIALTIPCIGLAFLIACAWVIASVFVCVYRKDSRAWATWIILTALLGITVACWIAVYLAANAIATDA